MAAENNWTFAVERMQQAIAASWRWPRQRRPTGMAPVGTAATAAMSSRLCRRCSAVAWTRRFLDPQGNRKTL
uniref:Uncharacterized protein n=1 Tax=Oryza punctata TaxID=4537 RepID=A0A0E0LW24_ORYPU